MFDYHIHSNFSADCETPMEKTIEQAIILGLEEICFTEHIDYEYPDKSIVFEFDLEEYDKKIKQMQSKYMDEIRIKKGIEIGLQPHLLNKYEELFKNEVFDFVICSMHTTEKKDLHSGDFFKNKTVDEAYQTYYEELLYCVKNYKNYNILGHLDLVKRYTKQQSEHNFHDIIQQIFHEIIPSGKGIELNTSGVRYGMDGGMPSTDILKLYKECGGEIITLGSDSHVETTLAYQFKDSLDILQSLGFKYIATFKDRQPEFHAIEKLIK
ncbi:histidinol-phosphatase [Virgibacillus profundi]|uniref:Histidinol-phosphatase n=1 Tax=Virgibacillus profundi TaxID=2024555 RepID=A0A2A2IHL8_9BACI|nr:histidinol-phosphatase HisJ family protein [Virgibacillus profundi]PAV30593.1 histidinol-phosphatase [Virgibacillus profundi]PXY54765.1 PHP domain-containing protein [Virgibacillus profundi]